MLNKIDTEIKQALEFSEAGRGWEDAGTPKLSLRLFAGIQLWGKTQHSDLWIWSKFFFNWAAVQSNVLKNFLDSHYFPISAFSLHWSNLLFLLFTISKSNDMLFPSRVEWWL